MRPGAAGRSAAGAARLGAAGGRARRPARSARAAGTRARPGPAPAACPSRGPARRPCRSGRRGSRPRRRRRAPAHRPGPCPSSCPATKTSTCSRDVLTIASRSLPSTIVVAWSVFSSETFTTYTPGISSFFSSYVVSIGLYLRVARHLGRPLGVGRDQADVERLDAAERVLLAEVGLGVDLVGGERELLEVPGGDLEPRRLARAERPLGDDRRAPSPPSARSAGAAWACQGSTATLR